MSGLSSSDRRRRTCPNLTSPTGRAESTRRSPVPPVPEAECGRAGNQAPVTSPTPAVSPARPRSRPPGAGPAGRPRLFSPPSRPRHPFLRVRRVNRHISPLPPSHPSTQPDEDIGAQRPVNGRPASCPAIRAGLRVGPGGHGNESMIGTVRRPARHGASLSGGYLLLPAHPPTLHGEPGGPAARA